MSAISSVTSGSPPTQSAVLQQLQQRDGPGSFSRADFQKQRDADLSAALQSVGVDSSKTADIQSQIKDAVQNALSNAASGTDPRTAVKNAVDGVLKQNGIDPAKFQDALKTQEQKSGGAHRAHHKHAPKAESSDRSGQSGQVSDQAAQLLEALKQGTADQTATSKLPTGSLVDVAA